jgi:hypothetical protein
VKYSVLPGAAGGRYQAITTESSTVARKTARMMVSTSSTRLRPRRLW